MNIYKFSIPNRLNGALWDYADKHASVLTLAIRGVGTSQSGGLTSRTVWEVITEEDVYLKMVLTLPEIVQLGNNVYI